MRAALLLGLLGLGCGRPSLSGARRWACFYGASLPEADFAGLDMAVLDPDVFRLPARRGPTTLGYISAGEVESFRPHWERARGRPWVLEPNPNWPESRYVDLRSPEWRSLLIDEVAPRALAKGYDGFFLDTLDTAAYLEWKDPRAFAGSRDAAVTLVLELRRRFPKAPIVVNNAFDLLPRLEAAIDGALAEDVHTRYDFAAKAYGPTPEEEGAPKEAALAAFRERTGKPVFVIVYAADPGGAEAAAGAAKARALGFFPYATEVGLDRPGRVDP